MSFGGNSDSTFDASVVGPGGQYQGFGAIGKIGSGTWTFTGAGTYTVDTTVDDGTLLVNGSLASEVMVGPGGVLGGNGTLGGGVINNGTLAPGNSIGIGLRASTMMTFGSVTAAAHGLLGWRHAFGDTVPLSHWPRTVSSAAVLF